MPAVEVESLTISYGKVTAVDGLSFTAEAGEVTCLLGPNGAGKTSTVEALEGLRRPTSGRLSVIGLDPLADHRSVTPRIGVMLQEGGIHPAVRVREAMRHAAALYPDPVDVGGLLDRLGLAGLERRTYRQLSGGEQRRLALALALVGRPQVAFLDEPTSGVDPAGRQVIRQVVADLRNDGVTVILTTHDLDEAERIADHVVIILDGRLVAAGTVEDLTQSSGDDEQVRFRAPAGLDRASLADHLDGAEVVEIAPGDYAVARPPTPRTVAAITAWLAEHDLPLADLRAGRQRLEDVYLRLTADGAPPPAPAPAPSASPAPDSGSDSVQQRAMPSGLTDPDRPKDDTTGADDADEPGTDLGWPCDDDTDGVNGDDPRDTEQDPSDGASVGDTQAPRGGGDHEVGDHEVIEADEILSPRDHPDVREDPGRTDPPEPGDPTETSPPSTFDEFWRSVRRGDSGDDTDWAEWNDEGGHHGGTRR